MTLTSKLFKLVCTSTPAIAELGPAQPQLVSYFCVNKNDQTYLASSWTAFSFVLRVTKSSAFSRSFWKINQSWIQFNWCWRETFLNLRSVWNFSKLKAQKCFWRQIFENSSCNQDCFIKSISPRKELVRFKFSDDFGCNRFFWTFKQRDRVE